MVSVFQSLGRDSVGFSHARHVRFDFDANQFQSLGRDSVGFSELPPIDAAIHADTFQSLGRDSVGFSLTPAICLATGGKCFNPSVGILWGLAYIFNTVKKLWELVFQSLGRDSVGFSSAGRGWSDE